MLFNSAVHKILQSLLQNSKFYSEMYLLNFLNHFVNYKKQREILAEIYLGVITEVSTTIPH
jgi:hypothetical protein